VRESVASSKEAIPAVLHRNIARWCWTPMCESVPVGQALAAKVPAGSGDGPSAIANTLRDLLTHLRLPASAWSWSWCSVSLVFGLDSTLSPLCLSSSARSSMHAFLEPADMGGSRIWASLGHDEERR